VIGIYILSEQGDDARAGASRTARASSPGTDNK
jgi:hypothetical protein